MASLRTASVILAAGLIALSGCGGDDDNGGGGDDQLGGEAARLTPPEKPTPEDCGGEAVKTDKKADDLVPEPGTYTYDVKGTRGEAGAGADTALPKTAELRVTPSIKIGNAVCFRAQTVYTPKEADTVTFVVRGGEIFITKINFFVAGQTPELVPQPPIKAGDATGATAWEGAFEGPTRGSYRATAGNEEKSFSFEGRSEDVQSVKLDFVFEGELNGKSSQTTFASLNGGTLYAQEVDQERGFGGTSVRLKYDWKLKSFSGG